MSAASGYREVRIDLVNDARSTMTAAVKLGCCLAKLSIRLRGIRRLRRLKKLERTAFIPSQADALCSPTVKSSKVLFLCSLITQLKASNSAFRMDHMNKSTSNRRPKTDAIVDNCEEVENADLLSLQPSSNALKSILKTNPNYN